MTRRDFGKGLVSIIAAGAAPSLLAAGLRRGTGWHASMAAGGGGGLLPDGYVQAFGLFSAGSGYIDTGVFVDTLVNPAISFGAMFLDGDTDKFGTTSNAQNTILFNVEPGAHYIRYGSTSTRPISFSYGHSVKDIISLNVYKEIDINSETANIAGTVPIKVNGTTVGSFTGGAYSLMLHSKLMLFSGRNPAIVMLGRFKVATSGSKVIDYVPCAVVREDAASVTVDRDIANTSEAREYFNAHAPSGPSVPPTGFLGTLYNTSSNAVSNTACSVSFSSGTSIAGKRFGPEPNTMWNSINHQYIVKKGSTFTQFSGIGYYDLVCRQYRAAIGDLYPIMSLM